MGVVSAIAAMAVNPSIDNAVNVANAIAAHSNTVAMQAEQNAQHNVNNVAQTISDAAAAVSAANAAATANANAAANDAAANISIDADSAASAAADGADGGVGPASGADGGVGSASGDYSDGGKIKGPGNGISDSIHAEGPEGQRIRVSNGEYIIPADVVEKFGAVAFDQLVSQHHVPAAMQRAIMGAEDAC
jgi:hypothetical protein